jgi:hypothetical protein
MSGYSKRRTGFVFLNLLLNNKVAGFLNNNKKNSFRDDAPPSEVAAQMPDQSDYYWSGLLRRYIASSPW